VLRVLAESESGVTWRELLTRVRPMTERSLTTVVYELLSGGLIDMFDDVVVITEKGRESALEQN
jgi:hypothetical protein